MSRPISLPTRGPSETTRHPFVGSEEPNSGDRTLEPQNVEKRTTDTGKPKTLHRNNRPGHHLPQGRKPNCTPSPSWRSPSKGRDTVPRLPLPHYYFWEVGWVVETTEFTLLGTLHESSPSTRTIILSQTRVPNYLDILVYFRRCLVTQEWVCFGSDRTSLRTSSRVSLTSSFGHDLPVYLFSSTGRDLGGNRLLGVYPCPPVPGMVYKTSKGFSDSSSRTGHPCHCPHFQFTFGPRHD